MPEEFEPTESHEVLVNGEKTRVSLPRAIFRVKLREEGPARLFLHLKIGEQHVPVYLSDRRKDFRVAYTALEHHDSEISDLLDRRDWRGAVVKAREKLSGGYIDWIMKFDEPDGWKRSTRLHDSLQTLLREKLESMKQIDLSHEEFSKAWHSAGFTIPNPSHANMNTLNAELFLGNILDELLVPVRKYLHTTPETEWLHATK